jgi:hypothetical protein
VSRPSVPPRPGHVFESFVRELAARSDKADLLVRLRQGHQPDQHGWCEHPLHGSHWERHPCSAQRLADLVDRVDAPD